MADTGWKSPSSGASVTKSGSTIHWSYPTYIYASDDQRAYKRHYEMDKTHWLRATNFGFSIPSGAVISGIEVRIEKRASAAIIIEDWQVKIVKGGSEQGDNKASSQVWPTSDTYFYYGGSTDLWGLSWTPADINASNFGVSISAINWEETSAVAYVDHIQIKVYYSVGVNVKIKVGGAWKDATEMKIKVGGAWKDANQIKIKVGGAWKSVFG